MAAGSVPVPEVQWGAAGTDVGGMYSEMTDVARHSAAKSTLNGLMLWLGEAGLAAAGTSPVLTAAMDQHSAAIRDSLGDPESGPNAVSLAGYATGLRDALIEINWQLAPIDQVDWEGIEWPAVRLLAVCAMARHFGYA